MKSDIKEKGTYYGNSKHPKSISTIDYFIISHLKSKIKPLKAFFRGLKEKRVNYPTENL